MSVFFLSAGTLVSLRTLKAAFICMVLLILARSAVSACECVFEVPRSTARLWLNWAFSLRRHLKMPAPRTVMPFSVSPVERAPRK